MRKICSLDEAVVFFRDTLAAHPERDALAADRLIEQGRRRKYPVICLNHMNDPADTGSEIDEFKIPDVVTPDTAEGRLAREVVNLLAPLKMDNPVRASFRMGRGTGTLAASFGIPLDPEADYAPRLTRDLAGMLKEPEPDPEKAGLMPEIKERIGFLRSALPEDFKIQFPDMQGPFNLIHAITGNDAFLAPYVQPGEFKEMMARIVRLWLGVRRLLLQWIGPDRLDSIYYDRICECSVNMISPEMYKDHVLDHDRAIAREIGPIHLHHCSGPHVFHTVYETVPVYSVEAGWCDNAFAGSASVEEVVAAIGPRDICLTIGQELPEDFTAARNVVQKHLDLYESHPRIRFQYTGMLWKKKDRTLIRGLHRDLDTYWEKKFACT